MVRLAMLLSAAYLNTTVGKILETYCCSIGDSVFAENWSEDLISTDSCVENMELTAVLEKAPCSLVAADIYSAN